MRDLKPSLHGIIFIMKHERENTSNTGFTLIELLIVVALIAILTLAILTVLANARQAGRDMARVNDAEQYKLGIRLFKESTGDYPQYDSGIQIGATPATAIDTDLAPFMPKINPDPLNTTGYGFWYYSDFTCSGAPHDVVIVQKFEQTGKGNFGTTCGTAPSPFTSDSYIVLLD